MTDEQKELIEAYRRKGVGYKQIAKELEMSPNSVKSYCRRNKLSNEDLKRNDGESSCEQCGTIIHQVKGRKRKRFCSDKCRNQWWNSHLDRVKRKTVYEYVFAKYSYSQLKWGLLNKPKFRDKYVLGKINEELNEVFLEIDENFDEFVLDRYAIIMN